MEMIGGLLKTTSPVAIAAVAIAIAGASAPARAADLGGNCCADLEERVAELEATTVRKGNRKVSVTLSGFVGQNIMWWDDGVQSDVYFGDGGNYFSRFRFRGEAKISPTVTAGFLYEFGINGNAIGSMDQSNGGDDLGGAAAPLLRDSTVWMRHTQLGMVKTGQGSTATDNLVLIDLGGMAGAGTMDVGLYVGGFRQRAGTPFFPAGETWAAAINGGASFDTARKNHVLYETPTLMGFNIQTAVAEDNYWDVALRYAGEHHGFRVAFGIGYQEDTEFNAPLGAASLSTVTGVVCTTDCARKESEFKGSASALHVASGLFVTTAWAWRDLEYDLATGTAPDHDASMWYIAAGVRRNFFAIGDTVLFGEYGTADDMMIRAVAGVTSSEFDHWGLGINQYIDAAAMEVFLTYKHFETSHCHGAACFSSDDLDVVIGGARVNF
jgi:hypothetical protein